jgi:hypothetical protein
MQLTAAPEHYDTATGLSTADAATALSTAEPDAVRYFPARTRKPSRLLRWTLPCKKTR